MTTIVTALTPEFEAQISADEEAFRNSHLADPQYEVTDEVMDWLQKRPSFKARGRYAFWARMGSWESGIPYHTQIEYEKSYEPPKYQGPLDLYDYEHEIDDMSAFERDNQDY